MSRGLRDIAWRDVLLLALVFLCYTIPSLLGRSIWKFDEVRWAQVTREFLEGKDFYVLRLLGEYYPDKPPFYFWLSAGLMKLAGGANAWTPRVLSAVATFAVALMTLALGNRWFGRPVGLAAALLWTTSILVGLLSTSVVIDPLYCVWVVGALVALGMSFLAGRWSWWRVAVFCIFTSAAMLTKGPVGLALVVGVLAGARLVGLDWPRRTGGVVVAAVVTSLVPVAVWLVEAAQVAGVEAIRGQIGVHGFGYAVNSWSHRLPLYYFLLTLWRDFFPASLLLPAALWALFASPVSLSPTFGIRGWMHRLRARARLDPRHFFLLAWFFSILLLHSVFSGKRSPYIMPAFPAAALLIASLYSRRDGTEAAAGSRGVRFLDLAARRVLAAAMLVAGVAALLHPVYWGTIAARLAQRYEATLPLSFEMSAIGHVVLFVSGLAGVWLALFARKQPTLSLRSLAAAAAAGWIVLVVSGAVVGPVAEPIHSGQSLVRLVERCDASGRIPVIFRNRGPAWLLEWHLRLPPGSTVIESTWRFGVALQRTPPPFLAIVDKEDYEELYGKVLRPEVVVVGRGVVGVKTYYVLGRGVTLP